MSIVKYGLTSGLVAIGVIAAIIEIVPEGRVIPNCQQEVPLATKSTKPIRASHTESDAASFYTDLNVNGVPVGTAMIDTGASDTQISRSLADKAHIRWWEGNRVEYQLADNSINVCNVLTSTVSVGNITKRAQIAVCPKGDSLLGMSFVSQIKLHIENDSMTIE